jgi:ribosomal protein S18 acetylase RimI-like enzyme
MSDITHISKDLVIYDDVMDAHHGQMDGIIRIGDPKTNVVYGYLQYSLFRGEFHISMIEVHEKYQRKGYATILLNYVKKAHKQYKIIPGYTTDDGTKLIKKVMTKKKRV